MLEGNYHFTSESVSEGHPDKICDRISDSIVDAFMAEGEPELNRCGVETMVTTNLIVIGGEVRGPAAITRERMSELARQAVREIGYEQATFHWRDSTVLCVVHQQSGDIAMGVDGSTGAGANKDEGAGDQGLMFGYACRETPELMPAAIQYSHEILRRMAQARHRGEFGDSLGPDNKSQVTLLYENGRPVRATSVVVSTQHSPCLDQRQVKELVRPYVEQVLPEGWMCPEEDFHVNPTGRFVIGGPDGDAGLTGRKIIVDTYGGAAPHGGGAFSGKDPSKVDRSAAYAARYVAKNVVAAGLADKCIVQVAYAIGVADPVSVLLNTQGTGRVPDEKLAEAVREAVDLSPRGIRTRLMLNRPIYKRTSSYGHFGREPEADGGFSWERIDLAKDLQAALT